VSAKMSGVFFIKRLCWSHVGWLQSGYP
jgi:hypothetical protein